MRVTILVSLITAICGFSSTPKGYYFNRVSAFLVCSQPDVGCDNDVETVAEIVAVTTDGMSLIYTDSARGMAGMVDISDPANPKGLGSVDVGGEPTSVGVVGGYAVVAVSTTEEFTKPQGHMVVIDIAAKTVVRQMDLGGQPDAVAVSPDSKYTAIAIENERDEDLGDGAPPQLPEGALVVMMTEGEPETWTMTTVNLTGLDNILYPEDPEPEFVSINEDNIAVVTLQENNGIVMVDCPTASVVGSVSAGAVDLEQVDATEDDIIMQTESLPQVPREPDGVTWMGKDYFATADEGDLNGGSRGFTVFDAQGNPVYMAASTVEHLVTSIGHYPEGRSENKGNEPENAFYGEFSDEKLLFINSERSSVVLVYNVDDPTSPKYKQVLPTGVAPEGGLAIPDRNLAVVACENDARDDKIRSTINIYQRTRTYQPHYPTISSTSRADGTPIPFGALSGLAVKISEPEVLYTIEDSFYKKSRYFEIDTSVYPHSLTKELRIMDTNDVFASFPPQSNFSAEDLAAMINEDKTVNIDSEGIAVGDGYLLIASEGRGTVGDESRPIEALNFLFKISMDGTIDEVISLPEEVNAKQLRFGFEGVAIDEDIAYVAFQRAWGDDENPMIGMYDMMSKMWKFAYYPLDEPTSPNGGWVGLSDIAPLGDKAFLVLERDNQGGPDAAIKKVYKIDLSDVAEGETVNKTLVQDLMPMLEATGIVAEKVEGLTVAGGKAWIVNDNDGVDDNSGEMNLQYFAYP